MKREEYIGLVLREIAAPKKIKKRIKEDLNQRITESLDQDPYFNFEQNMGHPKEVAQEFMENLEFDEQYSVTIGLSYDVKLHEYKSNKKIFGLPLVHINTGGRYSTRVAKGIIAIGDVSIGLIAIGGVSLGPVALGGISLGVFALGGIAIGGYAIGGIAIGVSAIGGIAIGIKNAIGALPFLLK